MLVKEYKTKSFRVTETAVVGAAITTQTVVQVSTQKVAPQTVTLTKQLANSVSTVTTTVRVPASSTRTVTFYTATTNTICRGKGCRPTKTKRITTTEYLRSSSTTTIRNTTALSTVTLVKTSYLPAQSSSQLTEFLTTTVYGSGVPTSTITRLQTFTTALSQQPTTVTIERLSTVTVNQTFVATSPAFEMITSVSTQLFSILGNTITIRGRNR